MGERLGGCLADSQGQPTANASIDLQLYKYSCLYFLHRYTCRFINTGIMFSHSISTASNKEKKFETRSSVHSLNLIHRAVQLHLGEKHLNFQSLGGWFF